MATFSHLSGLATRGLRYHWRSYLGTFLGVMIATAALAGALIVGTSVRESLRQLGMSRIGAIDVALSGNDRLFRSELASDLRSATEALDAAAVLRLPATATFSGGKTRANQVELLGVDESFFKLSPSSKADFDLAKGTVAINRQLAAQLKVDVGDSVLFRAKKPSNLSADAPLAPSEDTSAALRLKVASILGPEAFGDFSLFAAQMAPFNAFVSLDDLQDRVDAEGKANLLLMGRAGEKPAIEIEEADALFSKLWQLADLQLSLRDIGENGPTELRSDRVFLDDAIVNALDKGGEPIQRILTYLVNRIQAGNANTPYSMATAIYQEDFLDLGEGEAAINEWLADDLGVSEGDAIDLTYYIVGPRRKLIEQTNQFTVRKVVPLSGAYADPSLMPDFPGLTDADNCRDWDTGFGIDTEAVRDKDEDYWDEYKGTPKVFVSLAAGEAMWGNRFGKTTSIRLDQSQEEAEVWLRSVLSPGLVGLSFEPIREKAVSASEESMDFGGLFIGFSFFLIGAALLLVALLFQLGIEQRASEMGTLLALGYSVNRVQRLLLMESIGLSVAGSLMGGLAGAGYAWLMIRGLTSIWSDAVGAAALSFYFSPTSIIVGVLLGFSVSVVTLWRTVSKLAGLEATRLLNASLGLSLESPIEKRSGWAPKLCVLGVGGALGLLVFGFVGDLSNPAGIFFGAGMLWLLGGLSTLRLFLRRMAMPLNDGTPARPTLTVLAIRNLSRRAKRSLTVAGALACGVFLVGSISVFHLDAIKGAEERSSGTGGFAFWGESSHPIVYDLNSVEGRDYFGLDDEDLADVSFVPMRVRIGEEASCLNLNKAQTPRLLGVVPVELSDREAFSFMKTMEGVGEGHPWSLLETSFPDGAVAGIVDYNSMMWAMRKKLGDTIEYTNSRGDVFNVRLVGAVANSILQGNVLISEKNFISAYPDAEGFQGFLVDCPVDRMEEVSDKLGRVLRNEGLELTSTVVRLNRFNAVQNTYLSTFQVLGGLGVLLGVAGLGVVTIRNAMERRGELGIMLALGFQKPRLFQWILMEHIALLVIGSLLGLLAAAMAIAPGLILKAAGASMAYVSMVVVAIFLTGVLWTALAARAALKGKIMEALRSV